MVCEWVGGGGGTEEIGVCCCCLSPFVCLSANMAYKVVIYENIMTWSYTYIAYIEICLSGLVKCVCWGGWVGGWGGLRGRLGLCCTVTCQESSSTAGPWSQHRTWSILTNTHRTRFRASRDAPVPASTPKHIFKKCLEKLLINSIYINIYM